MDDDTDLARLIRIGVWIGGFDDQLEADFAAFGIDPLDLIAVRVKLFELYTQINTLANQRALSMAGDVALAA